MTPATPAVGAVRRSPAATRLSPHQLAVLRQCLLDQHQAHREWLDRMRDPTAGEHRNARADARRALRRVARALAFMDMGIYGVCLSCGHGIPFERLQALPATRRCEPCQRRRVHGRLTLTKEE